MWIRFIFLFVENFILSPALGVKISKYVFQNDPECKGIASLSITSQQNNDAIWYTGINSLEIFFKFLKNFLPPATKIKR